MINTRRLKWIAIVLPILFFGILLAVQARFGAGESTWSLEIFLFALIVLGTIVFSTWVFGVIEEREMEIQARTRQLSALHEAALTLTTELELAAVLQKVVDLARVLVQANYGALGVANESGQLEQFITSGISSEVHAKIGDLPEGRGILGLLIHKGSSFRLPDIKLDPNSVGFPANHPPMTSFLGVPIRSKGKVIGDLYLTDKSSVAEGGAILEFTERDQQIVEMFATQAAIAIENAQLYHQTQQLAVLEERERFGMDLHDGIIQSIYAIGLMLEDTQHRIATRSDGAEQGIARAIQGLNEVIRDIRNYILDLRPQRFQGRDLVRGVEELIRDLRANSFLDVQFLADGFNQSGVLPESTVEILHVLQEALTNIRKHARATRVKVELGRDRDSLTMWIEDNGIGIDLAAADSSMGNGLHNMRERARNLQGNIEFEPMLNGGTRVTLRFPQKE